MTFLIYFFRFKIVIRPGALLAQRKTRGVHGRAVLRMRRNMMKMVTMKMRMMKINMMNIITIMMMIILGALVIIPSIRWPMAEPAAIRDRIDRPTPAWMSCKIIMMTIMMVIMMMTMMMMMILT